VEVPTKQSKHTYKQTKQHTLLYVLTHIHRYCGKTPSVGGGADKKDCTHTHKQTKAHTFSLSLSLSLALSRTHTGIAGRDLVLREVLTKATAHTHTHKQKHSLSLSLFLSLAHTQVLREAA